MVERHETDRGMSTMMIDTQRYQAEEQGAIPASAWLAAAQNQRPAAEMILPGNGTRMFMGGRAALAPMPQQWLGVYPNPSKGEVYVTYQLPEGAESGWLEVRDALGRLILSERLQRSGGIVELRKDLLHGGLYAVTLRADGILVSGARFIALR
ncbi:MAG: T9SS type A sorting domain-containing protein [Flavobacteriales bacterium]|nr:T9SS type A sorting domain-containing protein [Flavobacteriales bacterium]